MKKIIYQKYIYFLILHFQMIISESNGFKFGQKLLTGNIVAQKNIQKEGDKIMLTMVM